jgi:tetratricopeptide (TPR) repeat protein
VTGPAADERAQALSKLNAGDLQGAIALLNGLLAKEPGNADLLGLLGVALEAAGDREAGAEKLRRALALPAEIAIRLRNAGNLAALLYDAGRHDEAAALLRQDWNCASGRPLTAQERSCVVLLSETMHPLQLHAERVRLLAPIVAANQHDWAVLRQLVMALALLGRPEEALRALESYDGADRQEAEHQALLAHLYNTLGEDQSAAAARRSYGAVAAPYLAPAQRGQKFTVGVIDYHPSYTRLIHPASQHYFGSNYPHYISRSMGDRYRFAGILLRAGPEQIRRFNRFQPRVVINNVVSAETLLSDDVLETVAALAKAIGVPVINRPELAAGFTRQMNAQRLRHIPGLIVPRVSRFNRHVERLAELIAAIEEQFAYPFIIRTPSEHNSANMTLVRGRESLRELLMRAAFPQFYVIQYAGAPRRDGYYRRIRAAFLEGKPLIMRADYSDDWIVRSRSYVPAEIYRDRPDLLAHANAIIEDPVGVLGARAMTTVAAVGRALPLDIFGMDFDVDEQGRVVFFEANPSMNFRPKAPKEFPYPPQAAQTLVERMDALLQRWAAKPDAALKPSAAMQRSAVPTRH